MCTKLFAESACRSQGLKRKSSPIETAMNGGDEMLTRTRIKKVELSNEKRFCKLEGTAKQLLGTQSSLSNLALYYGALFFESDFFGLFYVH